MFESVVRKGKIGSNPQVAVVANMAITTEEWKEECGIADETTALQLPNCRDVFQGYASVPGQALCCPQVWVVLVECIGLLLEIRVQRHPTWEQTDSIRECSRYYPTMRLLLTHHDTSLRRLQNVGGLQAEHVDEAVRLFSTPIQVQECTEGMDYVMTPPIVAAECGPEAAVLCTLVEDVLFTHKSAHTLILTARFNFSRQNQAAHLNRLRSSLRALEQAHDALGECESGLMRVKHVQNAARNSLADVDLRPIRDLISLSFPLCEMFNRDLTVWLTHGRMKKMMKNNKRHPTRTHAATTLHPPRTKAAQASRRQVWVPSSSSPSGSCRLRPPSC